MLRQRSAWLRTLRLYQEDEIPAGEGLDADPLLDARVHASSRFRSSVDPARSALYSVHEADSALFPSRRLRGGPGRHSLSAVREFRRVPLDASSLALTLFVARPGSIVPVVAALAHFVERAVDLYQPGYLLLAHSLEDPRTSLLLTAVQDSLALAAASPAAFSVDDLLAELDVLLESPPERYEYCPEPESAWFSGAVSPYAV
jgi:hypothetical protein